MSQLQTQQMMTLQIHTNDIFFAHFILKIDEKCSRTGDFYYDLMMISDSGLLFWATLYITARTHGYSVYSVLP